MMAIFAAANVLAAVVVIAAKDAPRKVI